MSKILLINQGHTDNLGDIAINNTIAEFLADKLGGGSIINCPFWDETIVFGKLYNKFPKRVRNKILSISAIVDYANKKRILKFIKKNSICAAVIGGGELCMNFRGFASSMKCWLSVLEKQNIPTIVYGISVSSNMDETSKNKYCDSLHKAKKVIVRDGSSRKYLKTQFGIDALLYPDPVFGLKFGNEQKNNVEKDSLLFIPVRYCGTMKTTLCVNNEIEYIELIYNFLLASIEKFKPKKVIFTTTVSSDDSLVKDLYAELNKRFCVKCEYISINSIEQYMHIAEKAIAIISGRMHALILGLKCSCEIIPIPYKEKLISFQQEYAMGNNDLSSIEDNAIKGLEYISCSLSDYQNQG